MFVLRRVDLIPLLKIPAFLSDVGINYFESQHKNVSSSVTVTA